MSAVEALLAGPRGRRLLLEYALDAEQCVGVESQRDTLHSAVFRASYRVDVARGTGTVMFGPGAEEARRTVVTAKDVADRLSRVPRPEVTATALRSALEATVDSAWYWQEPDGKEVLLAAESVRGELRRIAEHVALSPHAQWWSTGLVAGDQWLVGWVDERIDSLDAAVIAPTAAELLRDYRVRTVEEEERAARDRPVDPSANWSGWWWSTPPTRSSTRLLFDGTPAGLWFVEDSMGWQRAVSRRMDIPEGVRVYEVDGAQSWAQLCRQFPVEVTAQKRHDWYRTTGWTGRWAIPDWPRVAERYDGVHLTVAGYLAAAGTAIAVDDDTATVIAGWVPDETYWLTGVATLETDVYQKWLCHTSSRHSSWVEDLAQ